MFVTKQETRRPSLGSRWIGVAIALAAVLSGLIFVTIGSAAPPLYTPGDLVVYGVTPNATKASYPSAVSLYEYDGSGAAQTGATVALPTSDSTTGGVTEHGYTDSGSAGSDGFLSLSSDGDQLAMAGYDAPLTLGSKITGTAAAAYPRTVALVDAGGDVDTTTALNNVADGNNMRSAVSDDGGNLWTGDASDGVSYAPAGTGSASPAGANATNLTDSDAGNVDQVQVFDGQLYASSVSTSSISEVGSGLPQTVADASPVTPLNFASGQAPTSPYGFAFLSLNDASDGAPDTLYVADQGADASDTTCPAVDTASTCPGAIVKYGLIDGVWTQEGSVAVPYVMGVTAQDDDGVVTIYASSYDFDSDTTGFLYKIDDTSGLTGKASSEGQLTGSATQIAQAPSGVTFRGVAFAPGTTIGSGGGTAPSATLTVNPADTSLEGAIGNSTNPTLAVSITDPDSSATIETPTVTSSNTAVAASATLTPVVGQSGEYRLAVVPGATVGESTLTVHETDSDANTASTQISYGLSANYGSASEVYYTGAGDASTEIDLGHGYIAAGDDLSNAIRVYNAGSSGAPAETFDFDSQLPDGAASVDIEASAKVGDVIYWLGSMSLSSSGNVRPATDTLFATQVSYPNGSDAAPVLTYLGSYSHLREDLIAWDQSHGNVLGLAAASAATAKSPTGFNVEGMAFGPKSTTTAYIAFRSPLEPYGSGNEALLVPVTNLPSLIGASADGSASFGSAVELNLGGLGIREVRKNADDQYLIVAGQTTGDNDDFALYSWDGQASDHPTLLDTTWAGDSTPSNVLPSNPTSPTGPVVTTGASSPDTGAWEGIVSVPDPLRSGTQTELVQDDGDVDWYDSGFTAKSKPSLPAGLQKDLGRTFTIELPSQTISFKNAAPAYGFVGGKYDATASSSAGLPVTLSLDGSSAGCSLSGSTVTFTAPGQCVIDANQPGDISASPAPQAQTKITIAGQPSAKITGVKSGAVYKVYKVVGTHFKCVDGINGPGIASCKDSRGATAGADKLSTDKPGHYTYAVTAVSLDGATATTSVSYAVAAKPKIKRISPGKKLTFTVGQKVVSRFTCKDGADGPGIKSCKDGQGHRSGRFDLATKKSGRHSYKLIAVSKDGQRATVVVRYKVVKKVRKQRKNR